MYLLDLVDSRAVDADKYIHTPLKTAASYSSLPHVITIQATFIYLNVLIVYL